MLMEIRRVYNESFFNFVQVEKKNSGQKTERERGFDLNFFCEKFILYYQFEGQKLLNKIYRNSWTTRYTE